MTVLTAIYRIKRNGNIKSETTDIFKTKKEFKEDLKGNGCRVIKILTSKQIEEIKQMHYAEATEEYQEYIKEIL
jgi:uncharacterized protein involved in tolerance to divalent cations